MSGYFTKVNQVKYLLSKEDDAREIYLTIDQNNQKGLNIESMCSAGKHEFIKVRDSRRPHFRFILARLSYWFIHYSSWY